MSSEVCPPVCRAGALAGHQRRPDRPSPHLHRHGSREACCALPVPLAPRGGSGGFRGMERPRPTPSAASCRDNTDRSPAQWAAGGRRTDPLGLGLPRGPFPAPPGPAARGCPLRWPSWFLGSPAQAAAGPAASGRVNAGFHRACSWPAPPLWSPCRVFRAPGPLGGQERLTGAARRWEGSEV